MQRYPLAALPRRRHLVRTLTAITASASLICLAAACSSGGSASSAAGTSGSAAGTGGSSASGSQASCTSQASALVTKQLAGINQNILSSAINGSAAKGKTFWIIPEDQANPDLEQEDAGFQQAAAALGATARIYDGHSTPSQYVQGIETAVSQKAAAIVILAIDPSLVTSALAQAAAAHIPVVNAWGGSPSGTNSTGIVSDVTPDDISLGEQQANYVLAQTNCQAHAVVFIVQAVPAQTLLGQGVQEEFAKLCPSDCSVDVQSISVANFATQLSGLVSNYLQAHPGTNYIILGTDSMTSLAYLGEKQLSKSVPIIGEDGIALSTERAAGPQDADVVFPPTNVVGWLFMDAALRAMLGQQTRITVATRTINKSNWGSANESFNALWPNLGDYESAFKTAWGIKG
jgi:ribose transport system substrate-binding protein